LALAGLIAGLPLLHGRFHDRAASKPTPLAWSGVAGVPRAAAVDHHPDDCPVCTLLRGGAAELQPPIHVEVGAVVRRTGVPEQRWAVSLPPLDSYPTRAPPA
jgi:hypothetical protein